VRGNHTSIIDPPAVGQIGMHLRSLLERDPRVTVSLPNDEAA
jgi:hypothetical protein